VCRVRYFPVAASVPDEGFDLRNFNTPAAGFAAELLLERIVGPSIPQIAGSSPQIRRVRQTLRAAARSDAAVFITGDSGTGKSLCARSLHQLSARAQAPFVALACGALRPEAVDAALFGGQDTAAGAPPARGAVAEAEGGTLVLEDICALPGTLQARLLDLLASSSYRRAGEAQPRPADIRVIATTCEQPQHAIAEGRLRADLYYRLNVLPIHLPPLRERRQDAVEIAEVMLRELAGAEGLSCRGLAPETMALIETLDWPGNLHQLRNALLAGLLQETGPFLTAQMLPPELPHRAEAPAAAAPAAENGRDGFDALAGLTLAEIERRAIERAIDRNGGSVPQAARSLDVSPSTLYRKLSAWGQPAGRARMGAGDLPAR